MALTLKAFNAPNGADNSQRRTKVLGTGTLTGTYPATAGGEPINWQALQTAAGENVLVPSNTQNPIWAEFQIVPPAGAPASTVILQYNYGTSKLQIIAMGTAATENTLFEELAEGFIYPAALTGATIYFAAEWPFTD